MSLGTVKSSLHRALHRMRARSRGGDRDPPPRPLEPADEPARGGRSGEAERAAALAHLRGLRRLPGRAAGGPARARAGGARPCPGRGAAAAGRRPAGRACRRVWPKRRGPPAAGGPLGVVGGAVAAAAAAIAFVALRAPAAGPPLPPPSRAHRGPRSRRRPLRRLERQLAREHAARYLSEAQDVLVTVAAAPLAATAKRARVDIEDEARRSRELLARRALLVETGREEVASARPVLDDVEEHAAPGGGPAPCVAAGGPGGDAARRCRGSGCS